jgi:hypothetical protein
VCHGQATSVSTSHVGGLERRTWRVEIAAVSRRGQMCLILRSTFAFSIEGRLTDRSRYRNFSKARPVPAQPVLTRASLLLLVPRQVPELRSRLTELRSPKTRRSDDRRLPVISLQMGASDHQTNQRAVLARRMRPIKPAPICRTTPIIHQDATVYSKLRRRCSSNTKA